MPDWGAVTDPVRIKRIKPLYPEDQRLRRNKATVKLAAVIQEDGYVTDVKLCELQGEQEFAVSAANTVLFWRYRPATLEGCPVAVRFRIWVDYEVR